MSKEKVLKIRDSLKAIYDLYEEVYDLFFTTYNYEPDFFDEYIVAYLMGFDRKITTIGELKDADEWIRNNHVAVYYDKGAISPGASCLTVPVYPQNIPTGVFHPKVIVIYGQLKQKKKEVVYLFVSSCNLTVSGYGRNKEAFACVEIKSISLAESLINFINALDNNGLNNHNQLLDYLRTIRIKNDSVEFLWTYNDKGKKLLNYFEDNCSGDLTVISPYFDDNGPKKLLEHITKRKNTTIIPAVDGETYNIHKNDYEELLKQEGISFKELLNEDSSRFIHAKIIKYGEKIFVGSYNFTSAAMKGLNAEATLIFNNNESFSYSVNNITESKFLPDNQTISNRDEAEADKNSIFVIFTVQWKELRIYIKSENLEKNELYSLRIDGFSEDLVSNLASDVELKITTDLANKFLKHKSFTVYKNNICCFKGLINEIDTEDYRPEICCESLNESLKEWFINYDNSNSTNRQSLRLINEEDEETEKVLGISQEYTADIFDNYYLVSKALENLLTKIEEARTISREKEPVAQRKTEQFWNRHEEWEQEKEKADKNLYGFLVTKPGSIENILAFLEKEHSEKQSKDIVYEWLIVSYINCAISQFPKNLIHNDGNKIYKEKLAFLNEKTKNLEKDIETTLREEIDKKYLDWITAEFNKRLQNV